MSDRHDLRRQTREIREALSRFEPEQLIDILTHIFRQYVMEGAAAPASSVTMHDELQGLSFPQLIERLQLRLDLPELKLLEVAGGRVHCRVDGRLVPLEQPDARAPEPLPVVRVSNIQQIQLTAQQTNPPAPPPSSPGTETRELPVAMPPGVAPVGHSGSARPDGTARPPAARPAAAPAPAPAPAPAAPRPAGPAAATAAAAPARPAPAAPARPDKPPPPEKADNAGRFNLLEID